MSEPVSNSNVEDVLASIRRLVSEERRPFRTPATVRDDRASDRTDAGRPDAPERLVLTPSLRVSDPDGPADDDPTERDLRAADGERSGGRSSPDGLSGPLRLDETARLPDEPAAATAGAQRSAALVTGGGEGDDPNMPGHGIGASADGAQPLSTELRADRVGVSVASDGTLADIGSRHTAAAGQGDQNDARTGLTPGKFYSSESAGTPAGERHAAGGSDGPVEEKLAGVETATADGEESLEPEDLAEDDAWVASSAPAPAQGDAPRPGDGRDDPLVLEPEDRSDLENEVSADAQMPEDPEGAVSAQGAVPAGNVDDEILRELVGDIVRQELSGELGERITRNVRKLVRREIQRALASREFD